MRVKDLSKSDRPRERLLSSGAAALADRELLAVLLGSGFRGASALDLASQVIEQCGDLDALGRSDPHRLLTLRGIGPAKAARVSAAFHLARRAEARPERERITSTTDLAQACAPLLRGRAQECLVLVVCDTRGRLLRRTVMTQGDSERTVMPVRQVITEVLTSGGALFGLAHNHPGGSLEPSREDVEATIRLTEAAETVGLRLLDHVIITDTGWRRIPT
ncbi:DNA repair protein RadC [Nonomuraea maritima]|jgi:DNA repair protein RadC|uniref:DNA repair protein RadC n=1 Tax=Nonomuraea maritima TaxID=683260 RepID=A0A1G8T997_9ACTN|nr:DNA repair protein RadC [Nonomuraea maritima]SDJ38142.1 DNA repair protein RadC [Nonomuraea maritima]